jgi:formate dehydrogenase subunit gamma
MAMAEPRVLRFSRTERALHWVHAGAFGILLTSGLCLWVPALAEAVGRRGLFKAVHVYTAAGWLVALALIVLSGDRRGLRVTWREVELFDADDRGWLRNPSLPSGRLNAGQKLNTAASAAFAVLFTVTGALLWYGERDTRFRFNSTLLIHEWLMYVSVLLVLGHVYMALRHRHSLSGITRGWVREDWARRHHPKWEARPHDPRAGWSRPSKRRAWAADAPPRRRGRRAARARRRGAAR